MTASRRPHRALLTAALTALLAPAASAEPPYPTNTCVAAKLRAAATQCKSVLRAWAAWEGHQTDTTRDAAIAAAAAKLTRDWARAEARSSNAGVDCVGTTINDPDLATLVEDAAAATAAGVNAGLDLGNGAHRECGARLLRAAAARCRRILQAHGEYVKKAGTGSAATRRAAKTQGALSRFAHVWANTAGGATCPTSATFPGTDAQLAQLEGDVLFENTVSPNVSSTFGMITPGTVNYLGQTLQPICSRGTPYAFWAKRGTVNKLVVYYQGGGACWSYTTCSPALGIFDDDVNPAQDDPSLAMTGLADLDNPANPFRDWNVVFVSYCTGDIHFGNAFQNYQLTNAADIPIHHRGFVNSQVVEKWAREHFVVPDEVFITGSSAGAYGAIFNSAYLMTRTWPAARFFVLGDAGNGVITDDFLQNELANWGFDAHIPRFIPGLNQPLTEITFGEVYPAAASFFPDARFAQYTTAFDGGLGGQTSFYQVMLNPTNVIAWTRWWEASCAWNANMRQLAIDTAAAAPANYRYYIGAGSRHVMWNADKVYTETKGGVIPVADWLSAMIGDGVGWDNVETTDVSRNPGTCAVDPMISCFANADCPGGTCDGEDPAPEPLVAPFGPGGAITCP
jgi:hypothetical protein